LGEGGALRGGSGKGSLGWKKKRIRTNGGMGNNLQDKTYKYLAVNHVRDETQVVTPETVGLWARYAKKNRAKKCSISSATARFSLSARSMGLQKKERQRGGNRQARKKN